MSAFTARFIGSGDAFGSGGRLQTCILVDAPGVRFAIDFGATSLAGLRKQGIDPNTIDAILLTHLHGDHCAGVPFLLLDAMLGAKRASPLTIIGPRDIQQLQATLFPGSSAMQPSFDLAYTEISPDTAATLSDPTITAIDARHTSQTNPLALRIDFGGKTMAFTGDGELTQKLIDFVAGVDLLVAECYFYSKSVKWHMNYPDISKLSAGNIVLTHMSEDMLAHVDDVPETCAFDGCVIEF